MASQPLGEPQPFVWQWLPLRLALVAVPAWLTFSLLVFNVGWTTKLIVASVFAISLTSPEAGLLTTAAIAPLGYLIAPLVGPLNFRISEAVVVAFLTAWLLRGLPDRRGPRVALPAAGWLFAAVIVASVAGMALQIRAYPGLLGATVDLLVHADYLVARDALGFVDAARLLEGLALLAATVLLFRRAPRLSVTLPAALILSASVAALSSVLLWFGIGPAAAVQRYARIGYRVSAHTADVNASGSYFAMMTCLAIGMAARARGRVRACWLTAAAISGIGLWFSESRSALAAVGVVGAVAVAWAATSRIPFRARAITLAMITVVALGAGAIRAQLLERDPTYRGAGFRTQFNAASLRMIEVRPFFGVGVGQYYQTSPLFLSPQLAFAYGFENAHNNFLQIGAELGLVGLALFLCCVGAPLARSLLALADAPRDARLLGATAGIIAFLGTGLTGHPLLVPEASFPFWMQLGLVTALAGSARMNAAQDGGRRTAVAIPGSAAIVATAVAILLVAPVVSSRHALIPLESQAVNGFFGWERLDDGTRFRWTGAYGSLFVPADTTRIELPVRMPADGRTIQPMGVEVMIGGTDRGRTLVGSGWAILNIALPKVDPPVAFTRIDLKMDRTWQPAASVTGSADMRAVGVQVGEPRLFRE